MTYKELWQSLADIYEKREAQAIVRTILEVRFHLGYADILCDKVTYLSAKERTELKEIMRRLQQAEPVQYILGETIFAGRAFKVNRNVLIPRPETEVLCQWIISECNESDHHSSILDIGTGSGCIAISLALELEKSKVTAWDISSEALITAKENAKALKAKVLFEQRDALKLQKEEAIWDIIVSNPPYITEKERRNMERNVLEYEPSMALFVPDNNPLCFYESIALYAAHALKPGASLFFEINPLYTLELKKLLQNLGFNEIAGKKDQFGRNRFIKAKKTFAK